MTRGEQIEQELIQQEIIDCQDMIEREKFNLALAKSEGKEDLYFYTDMINFLEDEIIELKYQIA